MFTETDIICSIPQTDTNVLPVPSDQKAWTEGTTVRFECSDPTEVVVGPIELLCGSEGWLGTPPKCIKTGYFPCLKLFVPSDLLKEHLLSQ